MNYYTYCKNNPIFYWDPYGLKEVALRDVIKDYYGSDNDLQWDATTKTATIYGASFSAALGNAKINSKGVMIINDEIFSTNPLPGRGLNVTTSQDILEYFPIVKYIEAAVGRDLNGNKLTTSQRGDKALSGLKDGIDAAVSGQIMAGVQVTGPTVMYNGNLVNVYRGGNNFTVKSNEIKTDPITGFVKTTHGVSVDVNASTVSKFGGAYRIESMPEGLQIVQRGTRLEHFEIVPSRPMPLNQFQDLLNKIGISLLKP